MANLSNINNVLRVSSNLRVGINTDAASYALEIGGTNSGIKLKNSGGSGKVYSILSDTSGNFQIYDDAAGDGRLVINDIGNATSAKNVLLNGYLSVEGTTGNTGGATDRWIGGDGTAGTWFYNVPTGSSHLFGINNSNVLTLNGTGAAFTGIVTTDKIFVAKGQNLTHTASSVKISQENTTKSQIRCYGADVNTAGTFELILSSTDGTPSYTALAFDNTANATFAGNIYSGLNGMMEFRSSSYNNRQIGIDSQGFYVFNPVAVSGGRYDLKMNDSGNAIFAGNVNVGGSVSSPASVGTVLGVVGRNGIGAGTAGIVLKDYDNAAWDIWNSGGILNFRYNNGASGAGNGVNIDTTGNVSVYGRMRIFAGSNSSCLIKFGTDDSDPSNSGIGRIEYLNSDNSMRFRTNNTDRMRITSGGHILFGNTSASLTSGLGFKYIDDAIAPYIGLVGNSSSSTGNTNYHYYNTNASYNGFRFYIANNGGIYNFAANNVNLSDERVKHNIENSGKYLDKICSIPVRLFNYKDEPEGTNKNLGVIAQEVEAIAPELVNNDGFGETPEDGIELKTVYSTDMMYALMKSIQELKAEIEILKNK